MEVGGGELTIYDNLDAETGKTLLGATCAAARTCPRTRLIGAFKLMRIGRRLLARLARRTRSCSGSTAPRGRPATRSRRTCSCWRRPPGATTASSAPTSTCSASPTRSAPACAVFHPKGGIIRREMENYSRQRHEEAGYAFVNTPHITKGQLFETSGHLPWYADGMFPPMEMEGADYYLKPMNCPFHNLIFRSRGRSYRELPLRLFEFGTVYRYEKSGVVHGLTRVRGMTQDDAHIYCTKEQMAGRAEVPAAASCSTCCATTASTTSTWSCPPATTRRSSSATTRTGRRPPRRCAARPQESGLELVPDPGGAAFYGPKISVQAKDAIGRTWQMSTIQVDFNLPERFELEYQAADGTRQRPVMIHRALFGSIERFFGVLTEHYAGAFPAWLAPVQVVGIPIRDDHAAYLASFVDALRGRGRSGPRSTTPTTGCRRRSAPRSSRRSRSW